MKLAFVYAGQGSQKVGMGRDFYERYPEFASVMDNAPVDFDLKQLCFEGPEDRLSQTRYTQPCMVAFAIGVTDLLSNPRRLDAIGRQFPEVQYFVTHRVTEYHGWARYEGGVCTRRYAWVGESGQVLCNDGPLTEQELSLGFARFPASDRDEAALLPGEEDVRRLAAAWGVDPNLSRHQDDRSTGYLCTLP